MSRAGWTEALKKRLHRPDPRARVIVQADVVAQAAVKQRKDQWRGADGTLTGFRVLDDGRVQLAPTTSSLIGRAVGTSDETRLERESPTVGVVEWAGSDQGTISEITTHLDPDVDATGKVVEEWVMQLHYVARESNVGGVNVVEVAPVTDPLTVTAGASAADVSFSFPAGREPLIHRIPHPVIDTASPTFGADNRVLVVWIWAIDGNGDIATNASWVMDSATPSFTSAGGNHLSSYNMARLDGAESGRWVFTDNAATPRMNVIHETFTAATITFTTNPLALPAVPTDDIRFSFEDETPEDTAVTYEVNDGTAAGWTVVESGQFAVADLGLSLVQSYDFRATLNPGTPASKTPSAVAARAEEVAVIDLDGLASAQVSGWQTDPTNLKGSICEATITALQDGNRDYRDKATLLAANHAVRDIAFRVLVGWKDASGNVHGIHVDTFDVDDYTGEGAAMRFVCVGRNARLANVKLPPYDPNSETRERIEYGNRTLAAIYDDILGTQLAMDNRFRGADVTDTTEVTNRIENSTAIEEIDAVAYLAGGSVISSQGRLKFVPMHQEDGGEVKAFFRSEDIVPTGVGPGLRARVPEVDVPWDYDFDEGDFLKEAIHKSADALLYFDPWRVDGEPETVSDSVSRYIDTQALAETVGTRIVATRGTGLILWSFGTTYAHPYLEPGDLVAVQTDRFAARDPQNSGRAIRGKLWAIGRITRVGNVAGSEFTIWIQRYSDIRGSATAIDRVGVVDPERYALSGFRQTKGTNTVTYSWTRPGSVDEVWVYDKTVDQPIGSDPWFTELDLPSEILEDGTDSHTVSLPSRGKVRLLQFVPRTNAGDVGPLWRLQLYPRQGNAYVVKKGVTYTDGASSGLADVTLRVTDEAEASGTLELWTNTGGIDDPDPTATADATLTVSHGQTVGPTGGTADVTTAVLNDIPVAEGSGSAKTIYARWTAEDGRSTGLTAFVLAKMPRQVSTAGAIASTALATSAQSFASDIAFSASDSDTVAWSAGTITIADGTNYSITAGNTGNMAALTYVYLDTAVSTTALQTTTTFSSAVGDNRILMAVAKPAADGVTDATFIPAVGVLGLNGEHINPLSIKTDQLAANSVTAVKANIAYLAALSADIGHATTGYISNSGNTAAIKLSGSTADPGGIPALPTTNFIDFTATTTAPFIKHPALELLANGSATFSGTLSVSSGQIASGSITISADNEQILIGSATSPTLGTGIFIGKDGLDYEFRAGDPAGNNIHWDGTNLTINGGFVATSLTPNTAVAKRVAYGFSDAIPSSDSTPYNVDIMSGEGSLKYTGGSSFGLFFQSIVVPPGVTLTAIRARLYRATTSDTAEVKLYQNAATTPTLLATLTHSATGWVTVADTTLSQVVSQGETYMATVKLKGAVNFEDARYSQIFLDWNMANYNNTL